MAVRAARARYKRHTLQITAKKRIANENEWNNNREIRAFVCLSVCVCVYNTSEQACLALIASDSNAS